MPEKTFDSSLESKEIKPVNPKENQSWIFIGSTDSVVQAPMFGHLMWSADSLVHYDLILTNCICNDTITKDHILSSWELASNNLAFGRDTFQPITKTLYSDEGKLRDSHQKTLFQKNRSEFSVYKGND